MVSKGNKELISDDINYNMYFYSLPIFLKVVVFLIASLLLGFLSKYAVQLLSEGNALLGYFILLFALTFLLTLFILIFKNKSFGRYFGIDTNGVYFNNYKNKNKWLFVPWVNVYYMKKEEYYVSRSYVIEISLVSNKYEMNHYFRVNGDPFWDETTGKIQVAYSRIPFRTKELLDQIRKYCSHCSKCE